MDVTGWMGQGQGGGEERKRGVRRKNTGINQIVSVGPSDEAVVADACPPLRRKSLTLCCPLNTSVCDLGALCLCVCECM